MDNLIAGWIQFIETYKDWYELVKDDSNYYYNRLQYFRYTFTDNVPWFNIVVFYSNYKLDRTLTEFVKWNNGDLCKVEKSLYKVRLLQDNLMYFE